MAAPKQDLQLDRGLQNDKFQSWRLGSPPIGIARHAIDLPGQVQVVRTEATDYLHTRASVLRNHLVEAHGGRLFCFVSSTGTLGGAGLAGGPAGHASGMGIHVMEVQCNPAVPFEGCQGSSGAASLHSLAGEPREPCRVYCVKAFGGIG